LLYLYIILGNFPTIHQTMSKNAIFFPMCLPILHGMKTPQLFTSHPQSVGESYTEHLCSATGFGLTMLVAGFACLLHGLFPFWFERTGSNAILRLHERMVTNRSHIARPLHGTANTTPVTDAQP